MALFRGPKPPFFLLGAGASRHKPLAYLLLCRQTFLAPESKKNGGRHFRTRTFFDVTPRGHLRPDATKSGAGGRLGDATQPRRRPCRGEVGLNHLADRGDDRDIMNFA